MRANFLAMAAASAMLLLSACGQSSGDDANSESNAPQLPSDQAAFVKVVEDAVAKGEGAQNDMQKGGILSARNNEICKLLANARLAPVDTMTLGEAKANALINAMVSEYAVGPRVSNWIGKISEINSNSDGKGVLYVSISDHIKVETYNNSVSDAPYKTLLDPSSPLFAKVSQMKIGDYVVFSGYFFVDQETCINETSLSLDGKLNDPEFLFKFEQVDLYDPTNPPRPTTSPTTAPPPSPRTDETGISDEVKQESEVIEEFSGEDSDAYQEAQRASEEARRAAEQARQEADRIF